MKGQHIYAIDAETTEALVIKHGLALANEVGYSRNFIHRDCLEAIETMEGGGFSSTIAAPYYEGTSRTTVCCYGLQCL